MAVAIDRALRRKLISQAAKRLWRRQGARPGRPVPLAECPTRDTGPGSRAASSRLLRNRPAGRRPWPVPSESGATGRDSP